MIHPRQAVVVEGRYDKAKLASILDAVIIETGGFRIFKDKEKLAMLREIARRQGLVILTDSDTAGFRIRRYLGGSIPKEQIINAYIPDIFGKEKRKDKPSAEGKLGVEGVPAEVIRQALEQVAGADPALADPLVGHQLRIEVADGAIGERFAVQPFDVIRREQGHLRIFFRQLEGDIRDHHPQRQGFDADFLIGIFTPSIKKA